MTAVEAAQALLANAKRGDVGAAALVLHLLLDSTEEGYPHDRNA